MPETRDLFAGTSWEDRRSETRRAIDAEIQRREQERQSGRTVSDLPLFDIDSQSAYQTRMQI